MSRMKFKYSKVLNTAEGTEIFEVSEADSWEEARKTVDKGVYDRQLELKAKYPGAGLGAAAPRVPTIPPTGGPVNTPNTPGGSAAPVNAGGGPGPTTGNPQK